jgi:hypothetical protein
MWLVAATRIGLILIGAAADVVNYSVERRFQADQWQHHFLDVLSAILAVGATAALLVYPLVASPDRDRSRIFPRSRHPNPDRLCFRPCAGLWHPGFCCVKAGV